MGFHGFQEKLVAPFAIEMLPLGNFRKWGRGAYHSLWSGAVLGHGASWSLVVVKGQEGIQLTTCHALRSKRGGGGYTDDEQI